MKFYGRSRKEDSEFQRRLETMDSEIDKLIAEAKKLSPDSGYESARDRLFAVEGRAAQNYWEMAKKLIGEKIEFPGRRRKGATDLVNSMLNYGYGMLYARVWRAVLQVGLNPYVSFLHAPQEGKPTLVFDLIEEFRTQAVDRAVFTMITRGELLELDTGTGLLAGETKRKVIQNVLERLGSLVTYRSKKVKLGDVIAHQAKRFAKCLEDGRRYRPFVGRY